MTWQPTDKEIRAATEAYFLVRREANWFDHELLSEHVTRALRAALIAAHKAVYAEGEYKLTTEDLDEIIAPRLAQARAQAFEEAIAACWQLEKKPCNVSFKNGCGECADAIRALAAKGAGG